MKKLFISLAFALTLAACSKATDTVIPSDMSTWDKELAPSVKKLSEEDQKLLTGYLMRAKLGGLLGGDKKDIPFGTTIADALKDQREWVAAQEKQAAEAAALKAKMAAEKLEVTKAINEAATVTLLSKQELGKNYDLGRYSEYQQFKIGVQNKSQKEMVGISGEIEFVDVFDKVVGTVNFGISERIKPGASYTWIGGRDYNQFMDKHKAVWNLEEGKYTTRFTPESIIFADGSKLNTPK